MSTLQEVVHAQMVRHLVSKAITCPRTGEVLDVRTAVVIVDSDGDPAYVVSPAGWAETAQNPQIMAQLAARGCHVDPSTVRS